MIYEFHFRAATRVDLTRDADCAGQRKRSRYRPKQESAAAAAQCHRTSSSIAARRTTATCGTARYSTARYDTVQYGTVQLTSEHGPRQLATLLPRLSGKRKATSTALSGQGHQFISVMHMITCLCGTLLQGSAQGGFIYHQRLLYVGRVGPPRRSSSILSAKVADTRPFPGYRAHLQTLIAAGSPLNITGPPVGAGRRQLGRPRRLGPVARHTVRGRPDTDRGG